ncbi:hypothetical protein EN828_07610 [Mesorhizobium sp. M2D.F.Ca.ET.185.01.1.1]|uniref:DUF6665 family protein n=1 Tax=unclassified Mesorhizobium TaxID=325217 RepID=UPI000FC9AAAC|nr:MULTISPECIES: DUF6665 family protein [unclassified Mesorhizobium]TGP55306.1 hypothetical protein EN873_07855 [bacterium M00.F.Ca.ET.230.01.1.1]TGP82453.1 hypothetical protein EN870_04155 [bacterium M00.F.Ca.ET.227.01.1.1]TGP94207.1 hypothetical protein EN864_12125 [bacterium M00.F.Ca.ET.221.01.1.1]TGP97662.1 hypothetical protein EN865_08350 [bacterium M00.F.Ca.ET.222.01.1.1]TGU12027.1 hypothetical protein EN806_21230 [bacterium M00.F.Ca.ET.163.01.1.1]TGU35718.1 hypothetical protein EN799_1
MSVRMPTNFGRSGAQESALDLLGHEILAEKAAALGRAGERVEQTLRKLREGGEGPHRARLLKEAAAAVHAYFIQRELCGLRRHDAVIREYDIPRAVLVRLGAS